MLLPGAVLAGRYVFEDRTVTLPVVVRDAASAAATYMVRASAARRLLPDPALFSIAAIEYRDNDLGDYHEVSLAFFVRERREPRRAYLRAALDLARNRLGTWIWKLPVDQRFTCEAGRGIWGFPKTIERIDFRDGDGRRECRLVMDGQLVLSFSVARGGTRTLPDATMVTYSHVDGVLHRTRFVSGATGVGIHVGGARVVLGDHAIAGELRALGFPRRPLVSVWMEHAHGCFEAPEPTS